MIRRLPAVFRALILTCAAAGAPRCSDVLPLDEFDDCLVAAASRPLCESTTSLCVSAAGVGTVFFKHLRKAGGTTMRSYLTGRVCQARFPARRGCGGRDAGALAAANVSLWAEELSILHPKYYPMRGAAAPSNSLMLVTTLREPVARALSLQRFERLRAQPTPAGESSDRRACRRRVPGALLEQQSERARVGAVIGVVQSDKLVGHLPAHGRRRRAHIPRAALGARGPAPC